MSIAVPTAPKPSAPKPTAKAVQVPKFEVYSDSKLHITADRETADGAASKLMALGHSVWLIRRGKMLRDKR